MSLLQTVHNRETVFVALSGKRKSGKDFLANLIMDRLWGMSGRLAFGDILKEEYAKHLGIDVAVLHHPVLKEIYRKGMVAYGKQVFRDYGDRFCGLHVERSVQLDRSIVVIPDLRFKHELAHLTRYPCILVRVNADDGTRAARGWVHDPDIDNSASECDLDAVTDWAAVIQNDPQREVTTRIELDFICRQAVRLWLNQNLS